MRNWVTWVKGISFILCAFISFALNLNMFIQLSVIVFWDKIILGLTSFAFEGGKIFNLIQAGGFWDQSKNKKFTKKQRLSFKAKSIRKFWIYGALATIAIIASLGFTLVTTNYRDQILINTTNYDKIDQLNKDIVDNKIQIDLLNKKSNLLNVQLSKLVPTYIESYSDTSVKDENASVNKSTFKSKKLDPAYLKAQQDIYDSQKEIQISIKEYETKNDNAKKQIDLLKEEESKKSKDVEAQDMFSLIGNTFHIDKKYIIFGILLAISIILEMLLFTLSFDNDLLHKKSEKENRIDKKINKKLDIEIKPINSLNKEKEKIPVESIQVQSIQQQPLHIELPVIKEEIDTFKIEEKLLKFIYNKIFYYIKDQLLKQGLEESSYVNMNFCVSNIIFNLNDKIIEKYIDYLSYSGMIVRSYDWHEHDNKLYYKIKVFKSYEDLLKKRIR